MSSLKGTMRVQSIFFSNTTLVTLNNGSRDNIHPHAAIVMSHGTSQ